MNSDEMNLGTREQVGGGREFIWKGKWEISYAGNKLNHLY